MNGLATKAQGTWRGSGGHGRLDLPPAALRRAVFWSLLMLLTLAAFAMRFYRLEHVPPGLHYDEGYNGLDAVALLQVPPWRWPLFFLDNNGKEPLYIYLSTLPHRLWGPSILSVRFVAAAAGALLTPALAWLAWEMAPALSVRRRRFALWAGLAVLSLLWSQLISRYAIRVSLFALLEVLCWASLWRAWRTNHLRWWLLAGMWAGLSFYTYLPARLLPLGLLPLLGLALWQDRPQLFRRCRDMLLGTALALLVAAPLLLYFVQNPGSFNTRTGQVDVLAQEGAGAVLDNLWAVLGMAFVQGDANLHHNVPARPVLDLFTIVPFVVGILAALRYLFRPAPLFLLVNLGVMLLPTLFSEGAPQFRRAFGALPVFVLLVALGLDRLARWAEQRWPAGRPAFSTAGWGLLLAAAALSWHTYFTRWAAAPDLLAWRDVGYTEMVDQLTAMADGQSAPLQRLYLSPQGDDNPTLRYLLLHHPAVPQPLGFDGRICVRISPGQPARYVFPLGTNLCYREPCGEDSRGQALLSSYLPDWEPQPPIADRLGRDVARVFAQPAGGRVAFSEMVPQPVQLGDGVQLLGYWLSQPELQAGQRLYVRLFWRAGVTPARGYTTFLQLVALDAAGAATRLAGVDTPPGNGACATDTWQPGEVVVDELQMVVPDSLPPEELYLALGFYMPEDGRRLDVWENDQDWILIGPLSTFHP